MPVLVREMGFSLLVGMSIGTKYFIDRILFNIVLINYTLYNCFKKRPDVGLYALTWKDIHNLLRETRTRPP